MFWVQFKATCPTDNFFNLTQFMEQLVIKNINLGGIGLMGRATKLKKEKRKKAKAKQKENRFKNLEAKKHWGLLVIDDSSIRKEAFREAKKALKSVERIESQIEDFYNLDSSLYNDWYNLTFRAQEKKIENLQEEYEKTAVFHNKVITAYKFYKISIEEAYLKIIREEIRYKTADTKEKSLIDKERRKRNQFLEEEMSKIEAEEFKSFYDDDGFFDLGGDENVGSFEEEESIFPWAPKRSIDDKKLMDTLKTMAKDEITALSKDKDAVFDILFDSINIARTISDFKFIIDFWEILTPKLQQAVQKSFKKSTGQNLSETISVFKEAVQHIEVFSKNTSEDYKFTSSKKAHLAVENTNSSNDEEKLKQIYRKIVKKIHPDKNLDLNPKEERWHKRLWTTVNSLKNQSNIEALENIYTEILLKSEAFTELNVCEADNYVKCLEEKIKILKNERKHLKKQLWWGFSRKRTFVKLEEKINKELDETQRKLHFSISELKETHAHWKKMSKKFESQASKKPTPQENLSLFDASF